MNLKVSDYLVNKRGGKREGSGRKATGKVRTKSICLPTTEKEKEKIKKVLANMNEKNLTDALMKILNIKGD